MKNRKRLVSVLAGVMAAVLLLTLLMSILPTFAGAASSGEIRKQIIALQQERKEVQNQIADVKKQYKENENEIADLIAQKNVVDQEIQLLNTQIININEQISAYNLLIADKQDELDTAEDRLEALNQENKERIRTMEEEGEVSYWEVLFKANSFSDLLDRLNMVEEIAASDKRRLQELSDAANKVEEAQAELETEKGELETTKKDLDDTQTEMNEKSKESEALLQELLQKADDLQALEEECKEQENAFLKQIAAMEVQFNAAKQREWEAWKATSVPATTAAGGTNGSGGTSGSSGGSSGGSGGWLVPCSYTSITSPFGNRVSPTSGASTYHQGVDLDTGTGDNVYASRAGVVTVAGWGNAAGNYVQINHQDGFSSIYMHLKSSCVSAGQIVSAGQLIGLTGATGITTGDHLHFGISYNGVYVNPCNYVALY